MKNFLFTASIFSLIFLAVFSQRSFAQAPSPAIGDFGSVTSGNWSSFSTTWRLWDGSGWNTVPTSTPGGGTNVFILSGTTVTYDIGSTYNQNCRDLIVQANAEFKSDQILPQQNGSLAVLKVEGDTLWVNGNLGGGANDGLTIETKTSTSPYTITLCGSGGSVNLASVRPNSHQNNTPVFVFARNANINYAGTDSTGGAGIYSQRGSPSTVTFTVNAGDTVNFAAHSGIAINPTLGNNGNITTIFNINGVVNDSGTVALTDTATALASLNIGNEGKFIVRGGSIVQSLNNANTATVSVNGTYEHAMDGGVIPTATWNTGSTCLITGTKLIAPTGANQNFYNFTVNCDSLTLPSIPCHFDMVNNTIAGSLTFLNTNSTNPASPIYYALTGYDTPGPKNITINGSLIVDTLASMAVDDYSKSHPVETVTAKVKGNVTVSGNLALTIGSAKNLINLEVMGNVDLNNGSLYAHSSTTDSLIFIGDSVQTFTGGTASNNYNVMTCVNNGAKVYMDTSMFSGSSSTFTVQPGGTIATAHPLGLNGNIAVGGTKMLSTSGNYIYNGLAAQVIGTILPDTVANLSINNTAGVSTQDSITINGILTINGKLITNSIITSNGTAIVNGIYQHNIDSGKIPTATWNTGSTCLITGTKLIAPTNANQNFYNFTVNCDSLSLPSYPCHFDMANNTIAGSLTIESTNSINPATQTYYALTGYEVPGSPKTITINGNLVVDSLSSLAIDDFASSHGIESVTVIVKGNLNIANSGNLSLRAGSAKTLNNIEILGNVNLQTGSGLYSHSSSTDSLIFAGTGIQTYTTGTLSNNNNISNCVRSGSIVYMDTSIFTGSSSSFTLQPGGTIATGHSLGLNGNITVGGTNSLSNSANYVFNGSAAQVTGTFLPDSVANLSINNTAGVVLSKTTTINDTLFLANGIFDNTIQFLEGPKFKFVIGNGSLKNKVTGIDNEKVLPLSFKVEQNYPNPFNPSTTINYSMKSAGTVIIKIYNVLGREVKTLVNEEKASGNYSVVWDGHDNNGYSVSSGAYFYRYTAGNITQIKKMMFLK